MKKRTKNELIKIFWIFVVASIMGCILETIVCILEEGHFEVRQGVIYGPFIPVYGIGALFFYLIIPKVLDCNEDTAKDVNAFKIFIYTFIIGGIIEYLFSFLQECIFRTVSWEYSNLVFNLNGRTSLRHCTFWGIGGLIFIKFLYPYTKSFNHISYDNKVINILTTTCFIFMAFNIVISSFAGYRQYERTQNISAQTKLDEFLDRHYPDRIMDTIYSNKHTVEELKKLRENR